MAIFRCSKCGHVREVGSDYIGKSVKCPKCENVATIHDTVAFLNALIKKHITQTKELHKLRKELSQENPEPETVEHFTFEDIDIHNTNLFTQANSFTPIIEWFGKKNIQAQVDPYAVDTTGFFDEIALLLGNNFSVLSSVSNQIKYIQNKGYTNVKIEISKKSQKEIEQITSFCQVLYDYSFVAKYHYQKKDEIIRLTLQTAPKIRNFFNGIWMEWFALMELLEFFYEKKLNPACARSIDISFSEGDSNELDIFFLTENGIPICVECKTGEFRHDIDKYSSLRKKLKMEKDQFVICVFGLSQEQAQGMSSMYELTFVNENTLINHMRTVI
ncbi:MAG: phage FluMu protein Com [Desulforhopalus sp.]|jgi:phage FluMu protein Com